MTRSHVVGFVLVLVLVHGAGCQTRGDRAMTSTSNAPPEATASVAMATSTSSAATSSMPPTPSVPSTANRATSLGVAKGKDFSIPIPPGWEQFDAQAMKASGAPESTGALALNLKQKARPDYFHANIVVTPVDPLPPGLKPADLAQCKEIGSGLAAKFKTSVDAQIVDGPTGKTCRLDLLPNDRTPCTGRDPDCVKNQAARMTEIVGPKSAWMVTCNHDPRDEAVVKDCDVAVAGWKFD